MDKSQIGATFLGLADTDLINVVMRKERLRRERRLPPGSYEKKLTV